VIALTVLLAAGAVAATYAALSSSSHRAVTRTPAAASVQPAAPTAPAVPDVPVTPRHHKPLISRSPRIHIPKPKSHTPTKPTVPKVPKVTAPVAPAPTHTGPAVGTGPKRIVLDTDAASTYNPYAYPVTRFGDPALAIDADPTTAWTAQPDSNGRIDSGMALNLKAPHRVHYLLVQGTRGLTFDVYGTQGAAPASITDPAWVKVASAHLAKREQRIVLKTGGQRLQSLALWIPTAPASAGAVKIAEVAVYK
jgi:hypothetical protein